MHKIIMVLVFLLASATAVQATCGKASWYGPGFNGNKTASGQIFNSNHLTAAHRSIPFGTKITVTNQRNGKSVDVIVSDRGPFVRSRILDLSEAAASVIGIKKAGIGEVCIFIND